MFSKLCSLNQVMGGMSHTHCLCTASCFADATEDEQKQELMRARLLPLKPVQLSFWSKFSELQVLLCFHSDFFAHHGLTRVAVSGQVLHE